MTVIKRWWRDHSDGSYGLVEQFENGTFLAIDLVPVNVRQQGAFREFSGFEEACREADLAARQRGHVCDKRCDKWRRERAGYFKR